MRNSIFVYAVAISAVVFASGVAVGQRTSSSKFAKYLRASGRTEMDWIALEANVDSIRDSLPLSEALWTPVIYFDAKQNLPGASVVISSKLATSTLEDVKAHISETYYATYSRLKAAIPELSEDDFVLRVLRPTLDPNHKLFAECRHGNIVFH